MIHVVEREISTRGVVVATGPGHRNKRGNLIPTDVNPGDVVLYNQHVGERIDVDGEELRLIKAADIMARLDS